MFVEQPLASPGSAKNFFEDEDSLKELRDQTNKYGCLWSVCLRSHIYIMFVLLLYVDTLIALVQHLLIRKDVMRSLLHLFDLID